MSLSPRLARLHPRSVMPRLPGMLARPLVQAPFFMQQHAMKHLLHAVFCEALAQGELDFLQTRRVKLCIEDLRRCWVFGYTPQGQIRVLRDTHADVCIRGKLRSFILLAAKKEDPDTLFFQRQLVIEGDTDLGLAVKNLLDTIELNSLPAELVFLLRALRCRSDSTPAVDAPVASI